MKILNYLIFITYFILVDSYYIDQGQHNYMTLNNFAFGSCYGGFLKKRMDIFKTVLLNDPQMWVWMGDATYLDFHTLNYFRKDFGFDADHVEKKFNETKYDEFIGVWDDHDYGMNDANRHFRYREYIKKYYLDFLDEPENSSRRKIGDGIYTTYSFGDPSTHKTVRFILLDVRFDKDSIYTDENPDILGAKQWRWLEEVLKSANETFIFIVSGTQILPFNRLVTESWYPLSRERLFNLIAKYKKNGVVFLSGDIHMAEILKTFCTIPEIGYNIYEITSSGMSHYAWFSGFVEKVFANDYSITPFVRAYNFAKIDFDWGSNKLESKFNVSIIDIDNNVRTSLIIKHEDISYKEIKEFVPYGERNCKTKILSRFKSFNEYIKFYTENPTTLIPIFIFIATIFTFFAFWFYLAYKILKLVFNFILNIKSKLEKEKRQ